MSPFALFRNAFTTQPYDLVPKSVQAIFMCFQRISVGEDLRITVRNVVLSCPVSILDLSLYMYKRTCRNIHHWKMLILDLKEALLLIGVGGCVDFGTLMKSYTSRCRAVRCALFSQIYCSDQRSKSQVLRLE